MKSFSSMPPFDNINALALGKFDGMHLAHQALLEQLPPKSVILRIQSDAPALTPHKVSYSSFPIVSIAFSEIKQWSGKHFVNVLCEKFPHLQTIIIGYDFAFGKDRTCNANDLQRLFQGTVKIIPPFCINGVSVHSSTIKDALNCGDMESARAMLGRYYAICGHIITGQNLGSKALYATINIATQGYILPKDGVYASFTSFGDVGNLADIEHIGDMRSELMPSVSFIGHRLSTDGAFSIESHILDRNITLQSTQHKVAHIHFIHRIRDNHTFDTLHLLKAQITRDIQQARQILYPSDSMKPM